VIKFAVDQDGLILKCLSESWDNGWVWKELKDNAVVTISRVFTLHGRADAILTGDLDLLALDPFHGIRILTPAAFLDSQTI
jgi:predicted nucleic acid-binding protein